MNRAKINKNKGFLRALDRLMSGTRPRPAPTHFADRVIDRWNAEPAFGFSLRGALSFAFAAAALLVVFWQPIGATPEIVSFGFDKPVVRLREPVTLRWEVANIDRVQIKVKHGGVIKDVQVTNPKSSDSLTLMMHRPGKYSFELIAFSARGTFTRTIGAR